MSADDPIFDPWSLGDEGGATPSPRTSRWRGAGSEQGGVPAQRPIPARRESRAPDDGEFVAGRSTTGAVSASPVSPVGRDAPATPDTIAADVLGPEPEPTGAADSTGPADSTPLADAGAAGGGDEPTSDRPDTEREPTGLRTPPPSPGRASEAPKEPSLIDVTDQLQRAGEAHGDAPAPSERARTRRPSRSVPSARSDEARRLARARADDRAESEPSVLRSLALPRLQRLAPRLAAERHRATIDERLGHEPPSIRFRIEPRPGLFDFDEHRGAVLEVVQEGGPEGIVAGKLWLDPGSNEPTERRGVPVDEATGAWFDGLLLDFVRMALR